MNLFKLVGSIFVDNEEANKSISKTDEKANGVGETFIKGIGKVAKWGAAVAAAATAAAIALGSMAVDVAVDMDKALNSYMTTTGAAVERTEEFQGVLKNIYSDNYGESLDDISQAMTAITQQMGDMPEDVFENLTEDALAFRDVFGVDVAESARSAKTLMDQFGISAEEAFNLMTQGYQNGLDFSGELGDSINEYSVQFQKLGLSAEDMFNIFESGSQNGAFNLDKIGDAVKEFSIRAIDGSNTTIEGFEAIGLNADEMAAKFAAGGTSAREGFQEVIEALGAMQDPLMQNTAGVDLFGTMWEDLGPTVVTNLSMANGSIDATKDSLEQLKEVKYSDLESMFEGLKRKAEMLLLPIGNEIIPVLSTAIEAITPLIEENLPPIMDIVGDTIEGLMPILTEVINSVLPVAVDLIQTLIPPLMELASMLLPKVLELIQPILAMLPSIIDLFDPILNLLVALADPITTILAEELGPAIEMLTYLLNSILPPLSNFLTWLSDFFISTLIPILNTWIDDGLETIGDFVEEIKILIDGLTLIISGALDMVMGLVNLFVSLLTGDFEAAGDALLQIVSGAGDMILGLLEAAFFNIIYMVTENLNGVREFVEEFGNKVSMFFANLWDQSIEMAELKLTFFKQMVSDGLENAASMIKSIVDKMKGFFNFEFNIPKVKVPHFSVTPSGWKVADLLEGTIPTLGVEWYAKAMRNPMILNKPTAFGYDSVSGNILAGGEAGSEVVSGTNTLMSMIRSAVESQSNSEFITIIDLLGTIIQLIQAMGGDVVIPVYLGTELLDERIIRANEIHNLRTGGH